MPSFIKQFIEEKGCGKIPDPHVRHEKTIDGNRHVLLEWTNSSGDKDVMWQTCGAGDADTEAEEFECDTKKDKVLILHLIEHYILEFNVLHFCRIKEYVVTVSESTLHVGLVVWLSCLRYFYLQI